MNFKIETISFVALLTLFSLQGCVEYRDDPFCEEWDYMTLETLREGVEVLPAQEIGEAGKIYKYGNTLLVSETNKGIHVIDNSDKQSPNPKYFLKIPGNVDMAVKEGYLYADSFMDLVVIDINNLDEIKEVNRTQDIFPYDPYQVVGNAFDNYGCNFDTSKGVLVGEGR